MAGSINFMKGSFEDAYAEAITVAEEAQKLALASGDKAVADAATARLEPYRAGHAYHQP